MLIGVPKEVKESEQRVGLTPANVESLRIHGHSVFIEKEAGLGSGFTDEDFIQAGATMLETAKDVYDKAEMIIKVKEPIAQEYDLLKENQVLFTYLHLAPEPELTKVLLEKKIVGIAYETVQNKDGSLPLLTPMSEIAGRLSVQIGARLLEKHWGGKGVLLGGVPGTLPGKVVIIGGGVVGMNATKIALGLGADVTVIDIDVNKLRYLNDIYEGRLKTLVSNRYYIREELKSADLLVGAVLIPGARAPKIVTENMVKLMTPGSVIVDVAIDQGGCVETMTKITTHSNPFFVKHGVIHYSVANMPGDVPRTSTLALTNVTAPYAIALANKGYLQAIKDDPVLAKGVNTLNGYCSYQSVAEALDLEYKPLNEILETL